MKDVCVCWVKRGLSFVVVLNVSVLLLGCCVDV